MSNLLKRIKGYFTTIDPVYELGDTVKVPQVGSNYKDTADIGEVLKIDGNFLFVGRFDNSSKIRHVHSYICKKVYL